jgi:hypothetical protein
MKITFCWLAAGLIMVSSLAAALPSAAQADPVVPRLQLAEVTKPAATTPDLDAKKAKAKECSDKADAKKLHGKERKKFRAECKKA